MPRPWASQGSCKLQLEEVFDERESWGIMKTGIIDSICHVGSTHHIRNTHMSYPKHMSLKQMLKY